MLSDRPQYCTRRRFWVPLVPNGTGAIDGGTVPCGLGVGFVACVTNLHSYMNRYVFFPPAEDADGTTSPKRQLHGTVTSVLCCQKVPGVHQILVCTVCWNSATYVTHFVPGTPWYSLCLVTVASIIQIYPGPF